MRCLMVPSSYEVPAFFSSFDSRIKRYNGRPSETPTNIVARKQSQTCRILSLGCSNIMKAQRTNVVIRTSKPKKLEIRLAKSWSTNSRISKPCSRKNQMNRTYGTTVPTIHRIRYVICLLLTIKQPRMVFLRSHLVAQRFMASASALYSGVQCGT